MGSQYKKDTSTRMDGIAVAQPLSRRASINDIISRISIASKQSPIAIFYKPGTLKSFYNQRTNLVAVFAKTFETNLLIEKGDKAFVGTFDRTMSDIDITDQLESANRGNY